MMRVGIMLLVFCSGLFLQAGTIELCRFQTANACPPYEPPPGYELQYKLFKASLSVLPEESIITLSALKANGLFDYQDRDANQLAKETYESVQRAILDTDMIGVPSTLEYSYADEKPDYGLYYLWKPDTITPGTQVIFFLHGFGGCFRYYAYFMKSTFPDAIVVLPVYGYSGALINQPYMRDLVLDMSARGITGNSHPWLIGISAGGYALFDLYARQPAAFAGGISLASLCPEQDFPRLSKTMKLLMINGDHEQGIPAEVLAWQHEQLKARVGVFESAVLEGDHFFLFSKEAGVADLLRQFIIDNP